MSKEQTINDLEQRLEYIEDINNRLIKQVSELQSDIEDIWGSFEELFDANEYLNNSIIELTERVDG